MSAVVGIDLSTKAIDLVKLDEDSNRAEWVRCELDGADAWARTLGIRGALPDVRIGWPRGHGGWWEDVYLVAIEAPYGRGQPGTSAILNRVVGAVAASLPAHLRAPERCWIVRPDEWKNGLGLKGKPTWGDIDALIGETFAWTNHVGLLSELVTRTYSQGIVQNARDAYCLAMFARDQNAAAIAKAVGA